MKLLEPKPFQSRVPGKEGEPMKEPEGGASPQCCSRAGHIGVGQIWWSNAWVFDTDDGYEGPIVYFCPYCGKRLPLSRFWTLRAEVFANMGKARRMNGNGQTRR